MVPERPHPGLMAPGPALSPTRITPENNGKIRQQPDRENDFARASGGGNGPDVEPSPPTKPLKYLDADTLIGRPVWPKYLPPWRLGQPTPAVIRLAFG